MITCRRSLSRWLDLLGLSVLAGCSPTVHLVSPPTLGPCDVAGAMVVAAFSVVAWRGYARAYRDLRGGRCS